MGGRILNDSPCSLTEGPTPPPLPPLPSPSPSPPPPSLPLYPSPALPRRDAITLETACQVCSDTAPPHREGGQFHIPQNVPRPGASGLRTRRVSSRVTLTEHCRASHRGLNTEDCGRGPASRTLEKNSC